MPPAIRKAVVLYNPVSGRRPQHRLHEVGSALDVLRAAGVEATAVVAQGGQQTAEQARQAALAGCDAVFACGGDGTAHEVLQGMIEVAAGAPVALGVVPLGTGNVLANDLGLPRRPAAAVRALLAGRSRRVAVGRIEFHRLRDQPAARYFLSTAGAGADAAVLYRMSLALKRWFGQSAYYLQGFHSWMRHHYAAFEVKFQDAETGAQRCETVSQLLAVRISNFGGLLRRVAPGADLARNDFRLVLFKTRRRLPYLLYAGAVAASRQWKVAGVELAFATSVECRPLGDASPTQPAPIYVQADGELLGMLPVSISILPRAVTLMVP